VSEYWQIDPGARWVRVLVLRDGRFVEIQLVEATGAAASLALPGFMLPLAELFD